MGLLVVLRLLGLGWVLADFGFGICISVCYILVGDFDLVVCCVLL